MTKVSVVEIGHNVFNFEVGPQISLSLLSLVFQEDKAMLKFGIVNKESGSRPVVIIEGTSSYIDLLTARVIKGNFDNVVEAPFISYYDGCFCFRGKDENQKAFIDKEVLEKNFGYSVVA